MRSALPVVLLFTFFLSLLAAGEALCTTGSYPETVVLSESASELVFEYNMPKVSSAVAIDDLVTINLIGHEGLYREGYPSVPVRIYLIAIPPGAEASVELSDLVLEESYSYNVAPFPAMSRDGDQFHYEWDPLMEPGFQPESHFTLSGSSRLRQQRVVSLQLHPVRYDRTSGKTTLLKKATVHVSFTGGDQAPLDKSGMVEQGAFASLYSSSLLNSASAESWLRPPVSRLKQGETGDAFSSSTDWTRLSITERGMYSVSYEDLAATGIINPRTTVGDPRSIRIYWGGGQVLPESLHIDRPTWMEQVAIRVEGENDGSFDPGDRIEFFALGSEGWIGEFLPDSPEYYEHFDHRYANEGVYWLTWGGTFEENVSPRMAEVAAGEGASVEGAIPITTFPDRIHFEDNIVQDLTRPNSDGWFWDKFSASSYDKGFRNLYTIDADSTEPSSLIVELYHYSVFSTHDYSGYERGYFWVNGVPADSIKWNGTSTRIEGVRHKATGMFVRDGSNVVRIFSDPGWGLLPDGITMGNFRSKYYLDWIELGYQRFGRIRDDGPLHFRLDDSGDFRFALSGASGRNCRGFDVSDPRSPLELTGISASGDSLVLHLSNGSPAAYEIVPSNLWKTPELIEKVEVVDLRTPADGARYLMIVWDEFMEAAAPLATHRAGQYSVKSVRMSDVLNSFSWGQKDVSAVRDLLSWAYYNWPAGGAEEDRLGFALLVGDATSDWKGFLNSSLKDLIPSWFHVEPNGSEAYMYPTDDYFTYLDPSDGDPDWAPDIAIGRFSANSDDEVRTMVNKIVEYESDPELGVWRNRMLLLADDEMKPGGVDNIQHVSQSEQLAAQLNQGFDREKLYLTEYPINFGGEKPSAQEAYIDWIKNGFLISTYTGHGGFAKMADENIFNESVANCDRLQNGKRLGLFSAFSCEIGSFDLLELNSLAEILFKLEECGSIGSFSSAASAYPIPSTALQRAFFKSLFPTPHTTIPVGIAAMTAKSNNGTAYSGERKNTEKYVMIGDPALMLGVPELEVLFDNLENLEFQRGQSTSISGVVMADDSTTADWFDGDCHLTIRGMADTSGYRYTHDTQGEKHMSYDLQGPVFYRGIVDVRAGIFEQSFQVPLDTRTGNQGRVSAYVVFPSDQIDGAGAYDSVAVVPETPGIDPSDSDPPAVSIEVEGAPLRNGTSFTRESVFRVTLEDQSGINLQQNDDFYTIHLVFDGGRPIDLTPLFAYDRNSFQKGSFSFSLNDLPEVTILEGGHELDFRAADNLNQRVELAFPVVLVAEGASLAFRQDVLNYPNPFNPDEESTTFYVDLTRGGLVTFDIFTPTGKRIWTRTDCQVSGSVVVSDCGWDGRDADGDIVGNGTYLVRATVVSDDGTMSDESIGKVVVLRGVD